MKYCLKYKDNKYIQEANEIYFDSTEWNENNIVELMEKYPAADFILSVINALTDDQWDYLALIGQKMKEEGRRLVIALYEISFMEQAKKRNIDFFFNMDVEEYSDIELLKEMGVCYISVRGRMFFELGAVAAFGIPIRLCNDNILSNGQLSVFRKNWNAPFIRPEDVSAYEHYVETLFFDTNNAKREETLYRIYAQTHQWSGDLSILFPQINMEKITNRMLPENFGEKRLNCNQICSKSLRCHFCERAMSLANPSKIKEYVNSVRVPSSTQSN